VNAVATENANDDRMPVAVMLSGRGSNLASLIRACAAPDFPARIVLALSDRKDAGGLGAARAAGIPALALERGDFASKAVHEAALSSALRASGAQLVCLAGFMRILSPAFVEEWRNRLINIHPSLLPAFPGLDTHTRALAAGVRLHGCTVHYVRSGVDDGPIIGQAATPVLDDDDADRLAARVLAQEHRLYPAVVRALAQGAVRIEGERVIRQDGTLAAPLMACGEDADAPACVHAADGGDKGEATDGLAIRPALPSDRPFMESLIDRLAAVGPTRRPPLERRRFQESFMHQVLDAPKPGGAALVAVDASGRQQGFIHAEPERDPFDGAQGLYIVFWQ
jgi:phosphoribosylglycinamide formyltransferase 1